MTDVRRSMLLSGHQAVAEIAEGPVFWLNEQLPDIIVIVTWDTGGFVDWSSADANPHLYIARYGSEVHLADITGVGTNVVETKGEQRFIFGSNIFTSPGQYVAQVIGTFSTKPQHSQRFLIEVLDSVPAP
ncbi:hypothetical protein LCGC14_2373120 [marine sediment metagenome]|uniref:Uncharacterized protein n=1 Tax=marine sediment metagenome TaxID=412755 RepID=A0A0F9C348_9ZZZZ